MLGAPIATVEPSLDRLTEEPEESPASSPSIFREICFQVFSTSIVGVSVVLSTSKDKELEVAELPAASVALTIKELSPSDNSEVGVKENIPVDSSAVVVIPVFAPFTNKVTLLPASAVPSITGVTSFVSVVEVVITG